jgi:hypothetical protein
MRHPTLTPTVTFETDTDSVLRLLSASSWKNNKSRGNALVGASKRNRPSRQEGASRLDQSERHAGAAQATHLQCVCSWTVSEFHPRQTLPPKSS